MNGWILVGGGGIAEDEDLEHWVTVGMDFAGSLPPKQQGIMRLLSV